MTTLRRRFLLLVFLPVLLLTGLPACTPMPPAHTARPADGQIAFVHRGVQAPTVVFQSGLGDGKSSWAALLDRVDPQTAVFAYDRPGYGGSPATEAPRDPCTVAGELHALLQATGVRPPYLLVGHSLGGLYQYAFALRYPDEVAGLLLIEPTHPDHWRRMQQEAPASAALLSALRQTVFSSTARREFDQQSACLDGLRGRPAPAVPMTLLARTRYELAEAGAFRAMSGRLQQEWTLLLAGLRRTAVPGAGHYVHKDRPDAVLQELRALRAQAERRQP